VKRKVHILWHHVPKEVSEVVDECQHVNNEKQEEKREVLEVNQDVIEESKIINKDGLN
jgi:hypothetical protein